MDGTEDVRLASDFSEENGELMLGKANSKKRTLIEFDVANSGLPSNPTILSARLSLKWFAKVQGSGASWVDRTVQAHQLLVDWNEDEATKSIRTGGAQPQFWQLEYGAINGTDAKQAPESSAFFQASESLPRWKSWDLTDLTQKWLDGTETNHGVLLWATNEDTDGYDLRFRSSENNPIPDEPYLEILWAEEIKTVYFLKDHLGSIRATVDDIGQVVGFDDYDPWGMIMPSRSMATGLTNIDAAKNRFTGKAWDDEFGLDWNYFGARYYDPVIGRFLSALVRKYGDVFSCCKW